MKLLRGPLWLGVCGGLVFLAVFHWGYTRIDPAYYEFRDDGIITLSHARNWVDFGFIGINPSGERIEACSTPLQMLLYTVAYGVGGMGFKAFMTLQTQACTFALGFLFAWFLKERPWFALGACVASALALTQLSSFMIWHGSGMENALGHVLLPWTVWLLCSFARGGRVDARWVLLPFLASIWRVEGIVHVAPLLAVFCVYWHVAVGNRQALRFTAGVIVLWVLFNAWRFIYFGSLLPNTAVAQGISVADRMLELLRLDTAYLEQAFTLARRIFVAHGGYLLLVVPFLVYRQRDRLLALALTLIGVLLLTTLSTPFVFGEARLDPTRTTTQVAVLVVLAIAMAASRWRPGRVDAYLVAASSCMAYLVHDYARDPPYMACCGITDFDRVRQDFARIARGEGLRRPTVAIPDLGVVSWHKQFNILDLGMLGSSAVARLHADPAFINYFFAYAAPDILETHTWWSCKYRAVLTDPRFAALYVPADAPERRVAPCPGEQAPAGVWIRRDVMRASPSRERALIDDLEREPSAERLDVELRGCQAANASPVACTYVARSAYRVLPELRARGEAQRLEAIFRQSRTAGFDLYLVTGDRNPLAFRGAIAADLAGR